MSNFAKAATIVMVPALLAVGGLASRTASAQTATAQPCSGTLCDLYYGNKGPATSTSASPSATQQGVPVAVPSGNIFSGLFNGGGGTQAASSGQSSAGAQQPGSTPFVRVVGGRPANEPCTGTLCDLLHSGDPSPPQQRTGERQQASAAPAVEPVAVRGPARRVVAAPQPKPICHNDRDPWQCYR